MATFRSSELQINKETFRMLVSLVDKEKQELSTACPNIAQIAGSPSQIQNAKKTLECPFETHWNLAKPRTSWHRKAENWEVPGSEVEESVASLRRTHWSGGIRRLC